MDASDQTLDQSINFSINFRDERAKRVHPFKIIGASFHFSDDATMTGVIIFIIIIVGVPLEHLVKRVPISPIEAPVPVPENVPALR